jgi:hypothetical protein
MMPASPIRPRPLPRRALPGLAALCAVALWLLGGAIAGGHHHGDPGAAPAPSSDDCAVCTLAHAPALDDATAPAADPLALPTAAPPARPADAPPRAPAALPDGRAPPTS